MDILKLKPHSATLKLRHPADRSKYLGLSLELLPTSSDEYRAMQKKHKEDRDALIKDGVEKIPDDMRERHGREAFAAIVSGWEWDKGVTFGGAENPDCTFENVVKLFTEADFILSEVVGFVTTQENFYSNFKSGS